MRLFLIAGICLAALIGIVVGGLAVSRPQAGVAAAPVPTPAGSATPELTDRELLEAVGQDGAEDDLAAVVSDFDAAKFGLQEGETLQVVDGRITVDVSGLQQDKVHFYNVTLPQAGQVFFFIVRDGKGKYRAAVNACQVCWGSKKGFHQEGDEIVCNTCGNRYPLEKIALEKGGCNPIPINPDVPVTDGKGTLQVTELQDFAAAF